MKTNFNLISLLALLMISIVMTGQNNPDFTLASNGVTCLCPNANFGDTGTLTINGESKTFTKRSRSQLNTIIANDVQDPQIALTCTSGITNMSNLFSIEVEDNAVSFNQNLEHWDISNVTDLSFMFFSASSFNQPLNNWDVSNVTNMNGMFLGADSFNQPLNNWDVSNVTDMSGMFKAADTFNQSLNMWDVSNVTNMNAMFSNALSFDQPLNSWDVSSVTDMEQMLATGSFNQPLNNWDVSNVTDMSGMFILAISFNQPIGNWDVSSVTEIGAMFSGASSFNQPLNNWDVSNVTDLRFMFNSASSFDQPLNNWDVSNVTFMNNIFANATSFNQDITDWCVEQIPTQPVGFAFNSPLQANFFPEWGDTCTLGIAENSFDNFKVYPNPVVNQLNLFWSSLNFPGEMNIQVYNLSGKKVFDQSYDQKPSELNVSKLASGVYLLKVNSGDQSAVRRIVKK